VATNRVSLSYQTRENLCQIFVWLYRSSFDSKMNSEAIDALLESNRYSIDILPTLETFVQHQLDSRTYHLEANLAVLKFYQFHPEKAQKYKIGQILCKALTNLPNNDFMLCMYLILEKFHEEEPVRTLASLSQLLESCQFTEFWDEAKTCREILDTVPGFDDAIRSFIIGVVTITYQTIPKDFLSEVLNLGGTNLDALITARGWTQTAQTVTFPKVEETIKAKSRTVDNVKFEDLAKILPSLIR